jgi:hypothetical protein
VLAERESGRADGVAAWAVGIGVGLIALILTWIVGNRIAMVMWDPPVGPIVAFIAAILVGIVVTVVAGIQLGRSGRRHGRPHGPVPGADHLGRPQAPPGRVGD